MDSPIRLKPAVYGASPNDRVWDSSSLEVLRSRLGAELDTSSIIIMCRGGNCHRAGEAGNVAVSEPIRHGSGFEVTARIVLHRPVLPRLPSDAAETIELLLRIEPGRSSDTWVVDEVQRLGTTPTRIS